MSTLTHCDGGRGFGSTKTDILLTPRPSLPNFPPPRILEAR
jgi:hypothetical protein